MKKIIFSFFIAITVGLMSCKNDWTIDDADLPPIAENSDGFGYVGNFTGEGASVLFAVEVPVTRDYTVIVRGRASSDIPGAGVFKVNGDEKQISFDEQYVWKDQTVTVRLNQGVNDVDICKGSGNGMFFIDYIELK